MTSVEIKGTASVDRVRLNNSSESASTEREEFIGQLGADIMH